MQHLEINYSYKRKLISNQIYFSFVSQSVFKNAGKANRDYFPCWITYVIFDYNQTKYIGKYNFL